jgi:glycerate kinase
MTSIVIAPDSFKGSLNAAEVAEAMQRGIRRVMPDADIRLFPMADGGEGTIDAVLAACGGVALTASVPDALLQPREARFGVIEQDGDRIAVIEVAEIVGLPGATGAVQERSSYGVGNLLSHCLDLGIRTFMIGLGGSSTNDGGAGVLAALGVRLTDAAGDAVAPTLAGLEKMAHADFAALDTRLAGCRITVLADVNNPLCGAAGATAVFGPQKGVPAGRVALYDGWIRQFALLGDRWAGRPVSANSSAGAAGGIGYALQLLGASTRSGADIICRLARIDDAIAGADWVLTGEGRTDRQTFSGKAPYQVARMAARHQVPVSLVSGAVSRSELGELGAAFAGCFSIMCEPATLEYALKSAAQLVADTTEQLARLRFADAIRAARQAHQSSPSRKEIDQ